MPQAARVRRTRNVPPEAGEGLLVPVPLGQVGQERHHHAVHATVPLPTLHLHQHRRALLRALLADHTLAEDGELLHALVL